MELHPHKYGQKAMAAYTYENYVEIDLRHKDARVAFARLTRFVRQFDLCGINTNAREGNFWIQFCTLEKDHPDPHGYDRGLTQEFDGLDLNPVHVPIAEGPKVHITFDRVRTPFIESISLPPL